MDSNKKLILFSFFYSLSATAISVDTLVTYSQSQETSVQTFATGTGGAAKISRLHLQLQGHFSLLPFIEIGGLATLQQSTQSATLYNSGTSSQVSGTINETSFGPSVRVNFLSYFIQLSPLLYGKKADDRFPSIYASDSSSAQLSIKPFQSFIAAAGIKAHFFSYVYLTAQIQYHFINYDTNYSGNQTWISEATQVRIVRPFVGMRFDF